MTLQELENELGPQLRRTLDEVISGEMEPTEVPLGDRRDDILVEFQDRGKSVRGDGTWHRLTVAAVVLALMVTAGTVIGLTRRSDAPSTPDGPAPTPTAATVRNATTVPVRTQSIDWSRSDDLGSLARSDPYGVTAGPTGFVATGMGFDHQRNQGRVWFSTDGENWEEPAFDLFDTKTVGRPVATSEAFYVVAATNGDRAPGPGSEARRVLDDAQLYRSTDGRRWSAWGEPWGMIMDIGATDDVLLRVNPSNDLEWSGDGLTWRSATFPDGLDPDARFELFSSVLAPSRASGDVTYLHGGHNRRATIWASDDGRTWEELPAAPAYGPMVDTSNGAIMLAHDPDHACTSITTESSVGPAPGPSHDPVDDQWACGRQLAMARYDREAGEWMSLPDAGPGPSPSGAPVGRLGGTVIAPVLTSEKTMTVWTAPVATLEWEADPATTLDLTINGGSPQPGLIASFEDRVVIASPGRSVDGETAVLVGTQTG